jgi:hypothetical protein
MWLAYRLRTRLFLKELFITVTVAPSVTYSPPVWQRFWSVHTLLVQTLLAIDTLRAGHHGSASHTLPDVRSCRAQGPGRRRAERRPSVVQAPPSAAVQGRLRDGVGSSRGRRGVPMRSLEDEGGCSLAAGHGEGGEAVAAVTAELELVDDGAGALLHYDGAPAAKTWHH